MNKTDKKDFITELQKLLDESELLTDSKDCAPYGTDKWFATALPDAVILPKSSATVSKVLRFANEHKIPVTARGAGHGYTGACIPVKGGIVVSTERLNKIKEINPDDYVVVVEPGVRTQALQDEVEKLGLFYPPDPASRSECSIGGNVATNAGGPRCLKYGVTRDYVLGLEVVLTDGTIVRLGGRTHKNKAGFDLHRLFVGSEGLLGIVTEITLKLLPLPPYRALLVCGFPTAALAASALRGVLRAGFLPCALEIADEFTLAAARKRTKSKRLEGSNSMLFVELDGFESSVRSELSIVEKIVNQFNPMFIDRAYGDSECEKLWELRREFSYALRDTGLTKLNEDIVVPRSHLEELFKFAVILQQKYNFPVACFGHAGDGNIHTNIMVDFTQPSAEEKSKQALDDLFRQIIAWGGSITGEHGIGLAKKQWWQSSLSPESVELHKKIKQTLDPNGILNPGKFV